VSVIALQRNAEGVDQAGARLMAAADRERRRREHGLTDRIQALGVRLEISCAPAPG
jgi:hypothetical protein